MSDRNFQPSWYVLHTHPKQENRAESNLLSWNVETFVPRYKTRRRNQFKSNPGYTVRPLFPGYIFVRLGCEGAPFLLGLVLGPQMEEYFRRAMLLSRGDPMVFLQRPISLGLLITTALLLILMALPSIKKARQEAFQEEG